MLGELLGFIGNERTNSANAAMARQQMSFQERMANTTYQRAVNDLNKAGLNPMLAYGNGGAPAPQGASAVMTDSISSAVSGGMKAKERELLEAQIETQKNQSMAVAAAAEKTQAEATSIQNENNMFSIYGHGERAEKNRQLYVAGDKQQKEVEQIASVIQKNAQDVLTGQASAAQMAAMIQQLEAATRNLDLDSAEKQAMSDMWKKLGEGGAAAKTFGPILQIFSKFLLRK